MTDTEIMEYVSKKPKMKYFIDDIYCHTDLSWEKEDGINTLVCVYCDNTNGHEDEFVVSSGCGNYNKDVDFCKTHKKVYKKNILTPELLDEKVAEAEEIKDQAGQFAASALQSKQVAEQAKSQTEQIRDVFLATLNKKFWYGTQAEYVAEIIGGGKLTEGTIYFIYDYNPAFPNENSVTTNDD